MAIIQLTKKSYVKINHSDLRAKSISDFVITFKQHVFFLHGLHLSLLSIVIFLPIGLVVTDRFAPKKDKVETPNIDEI